MKTNETDKQLLLGMIKRRLTLGELGEAEERAEIFRTNQVTNYDEVAERVNAAQIERENEELRAENESLVQSNLLLRQSIAVLLDEPVNSL